MEAIDGPGAAAGGVGVVTRKSMARATVARARSPGDEGDPLRAPCPCAVLIAARNPYGLPTRPGPPLHVPRPRSCPLCAPCALCAIGIGRRGAAHASGPMTDFPMEPPLAKMLIASVDLGVPTPRRSCLLSRCCLFRTCSIVPRRNMITLIPKRRSFISQKETVSRY